MHKTAGCFMKAAVIYALIGFLAGIMMAGRHDFTLTSVHSHLNLLGWVSMAVYAFYYQLAPAASVLTLSRVHLWLANAGLIVLSVSLVLLSQGMKAAELGAGIGSLITLAALLVFAYIVFKTPRAVEQVA